jgi:hypothetical protein
MQKIYIALYVYPIGQKERKCGEKVWGIKAHFRWEIIRCTIQGYVISASNYMLTNN